MPCHDDGYTGVGAVMFYDRRNEKKYEYYFRAAFGVDALSPMYRYSYQSILKLYNIYAPAQWLFKVFVVVNL